MSEFVAWELLQAAPRQQVFLCLLGFSSEGESRSEATSQDEWKATQLLDVPVCLAFVLDDHTGVMGWSSPVCTFISCSLMLLRICEAGQLETWSAKQSVGSWRLGLSGFWRLLLANE